MRAFNGEDEGVFVGVDCCSGGGNFEGVVITASPVKAGFEMDNLVLKSLPVVGGADALNHPPAQVGYER